MPSTSSFPPTSWTLVSRYQQGSEPQKQSALNDLCQAYWLPLYAFARRTGHSQHEAEDLVQGFFLKSLETDLFGRAENHRGRLRSLLCKAFSRYIQHEHARENRLCRGGGAAHCPLLSSEAESQFREHLAADASAPDILFHRFWARSVLTRSLERLGNQFELQGQSDRFRVMRDYLPWNGAAESCDSGAAAAGMTPAAFRTALFRMRKCYKDCIFSEVRQTLDSTDERLIEEEVRDLLHVLQQ